MLGRFGFAPQLRQAVREKRIERDRHTVGLEAGLIVDVDFMRLDLADVFVGSSLVEAFGNLAGDQLTVDLHEKILHQLRFHRGNVLLRHVGIGVHAGTVGRVVGADVVVDELQFSAQLFGMQPNHGDLLMNDDDGKRPGTMGRTMVPAASECTGTLLRKHG